MFANRHHALISHCTQWYPFCNKYLSTLLLSASKGSFATKPLSSCLGSFRTGGTDWPTCVVMSLHVARGQEVPCLEMVQPSVALKSKPMALEHVPVFLNGMVAKGQGCFPPQGVQDFSGKGHLIRLYGQLYIDLHRMKQ
eukprot:1145148-Pelagomonas_calceolata.AAC.7